METPDASSKVRCRRTGQDYDPTEHRRCPYCFGTRADVARGDHDTFCEFQPGKDPISFGFPDDSTRLRRG